MVSIKQYLDKASNNIYISNLNVFFSTEISINQTTQIENLKNI